MQSAAAFALGVAASVLASVAFWFYFRRIAPRASFSTSIDKSVGIAGARYQVTVYNKSARRGILEPRILCTFRTRLPDADHLSVWNIPLSNQNVLRIGPKRNRQLNLELHDMTDFALGCMSAGTADKVRRRADGALESLFALGSDSRIQLEMLGYDELSGTRCYLASARYVISDVSCNDA